jgi:hypothetical protein
MNYQAAAQLTYNKVINKHNFTAVGVYESQFEKIKGMNARAEGTWTDKLIIVDSSLDESYRRGSSSMSEWAISSWISRVNYNYNKKYYLTASLRPDGSSRSQSVGYMSGYFIAWRVHRKFSKRLFMDIRPEVAASYMKKQG